MPNLVAAVETNRKEQQIEAAVSILRGINPKTVSPEGMATTTSLAISLSHYVLSLAQSLPAEQRMAVEAQVKQIIETVQGAAVKAEVVAEQQSREKGVSREALLANQVAPLEVLQNPLPSKEELKEKLLVAQAQEFTALRGVLEHPAIAKDFVPFEEKARIVSSVLAPTEAAEHLVRDTVVNGVQQILTNYVGNEEIMPDLTKSMVDSFRDVEQNQKYVAQCNVVEANLLEKREALLAAGVDQAEVDLIDKVLNETKNGRVVANTSINQVSVLEGLKDIAAVVKKELLQEPIETQKNTYIKMEGGVEILIISEAIEVDDIGTSILKMLREARKRSIETDIAQDDSGLNKILPSSLRETLADAALIKSNPSEAQKSWAERAAEKNIPSPQGRVF